MRRERVEGEEVDRKVRSLKDGTREPSTTKETELMGIRSRRFLAEEG